MTNKEEKEAIRRVTEARDNIVLTAFPAGNKDMTFFAMDLHTILELVKKQEKELQEKDNEMVERGSRIHELEEKLEKEQSDKYDEYLDVIIYNEAMNKENLLDWYISSIDENQKQIWTEEHIEELCNDFYVLPKEIVKTKKNNVLEKSIEIVEKNIILVKKLEEIKRYITKELKQLEERREDEKLNAQYDGMEAAFKSILYCFYGGENE